MSSSSLTATGSRSSSPATPESCDGLDPAAVRHDIDLSSWYQSLRPGQSLSEHSWEGINSRVFEVGKGDEQPMLQLDDLIEENAYDDSPLSGSSAALAYPSPSSAEHSPPSHVRPALSMQMIGIHVQTQAPVSVAKPVPPPATRPRKRDSPAISQKVVYPPKESCINLPIMIPSIPEGGTKSRVETQIRVTVDLAHASSSGDALRYDRVGSWRWLKLPPGTATKRRTRKEGKIDPDPHDILHLAASVTCATPPYNRVLSCSSCQAREAKRVARKLAARVRPARSDSDSVEDSTNMSSKAKQEDTTSIVQFNCAEVLDFSTGSVVLPLRLTCYCRHHREKVGFNVHLTMVDHTGRIIGTGTSRPIMITDDHKSTGNTTKLGGLATLPGSGIPDWLHSSSLPDTCAPSKRKVMNETNGQLKKRAKPYDSTRKFVKQSREASVTSLPSPTTSLATLPTTRSPSPSSLAATMGLSSSRDLLTSANATGIAPSQELDSSIPMIPENIAESSSVLGVFNGSPRLDTLSALSSSNPTLVPCSPLSAMMPNAMSFNFFSSAGYPPALSTLPPPKIHRLIPSVGPTHGGIEVTVLGANFHPSLQLNCIFGDVVASSTQRWSDNTLLCILPARASPGVVAVWFEGMEKENDGSPPCLFNYTDESDRALMELALQVVGLKMTGKIEDAKNVAMRIVGNTGSDDQQTGGDSSNMMQLTLTPMAPLRDLRPLLFIRARENDDFESLIVDFLAILDTPIDGISSTSEPTSSAITHATPSGQTLLHLAAFLGFNTLVQFLIAHEIDLDARDRNGFTALHFAALSGSGECAGLLLMAGADREIVNVLGKTPAEQAAAGFFDNLLSDSGSNNEQVTDDDEESRWGDAEEESEDEVLHLPKRPSRRASYKRDSQITERHSDGPQSWCPTKTDEPRQQKNDNMQQEAVDEKQAASFIDLIQRTLAQLQAPQGMIPNMPQLPLPQFPLPHLPHLPQLPGMPAVPWGALPQIPMVFPVFVPMPGWPSFLGDKRGEHQGNEKATNEENQSAGSGAIRTAQEWRATWEKWMAVAVAAATTRQQVDDTPPPMYTPRPSEAGQTSTQGEDSLMGTADTQSTHERSALRQVGYNSRRVPEQEVNAYTYRPGHKQTQKMQKKHDRMLILFWIPILFLSLLWGLYNGLHAVLDTVRTAIPLKSLIRG